MISFNRHTLQRKDINFYLLIVISVCIVSSFIPGQACRIEIDDTHSPCRVEKTNHSSVQFYNPDYSVERRVAVSLTLPFRNRFQEVLNEAHLHIKSQPVSFFDKSKAAIVFDLDETLLDNRAYFLNYKEYDPDLWAKWETREEAIAISETVNLVNWLNRRGYSVYFISGRREGHREHTVNNLKKIGITDYAGMYLKPDDYKKDSASNFKVDARKEIEAKGHKILAVIGDQKSDLIGGYGKGFKLPNAIYFIP